MTGDRDITPEQADALRRDQDAQLIDVREDREWDAGRIGGARHIVLGEVASQASTIDQDRPVVFYCRVGSRSAMAADAFRTAGYEAYSLAGGLMAWAGDGRPLEPADGTVANH
jgi:hydroxyacylglutathione hydrolase/adenylyltransferase/sulfurtransferase